MSQEKDKRAAARIAAQVEAADVPASVSITHAGGTLAAASTPAGKAGATEKAAALRATVGEIALAGSTALSVTLTLSGIAEVWTFTGGALAGVPGGGGPTAPAQMAAPTLTGGADQATLAFAAAPSNGGSAITGYGWQITLSSDPTFAAPVASGAPATRADVTVTGLPAGDYIARTRANNAIGNGAWSAASAAATVTAGSGPIAILLLGQSNMAGRRVTDGAFTLPAGVFALNASNTLVAQAGNSMLPHPDPIGSTYYTPTVQYLTALKAANPTRDIHVIPCANGGTDFNTAGGGWSVGGTERAYMDARLAGYDALPNKAAQIDHILHVGHEYAGDDFDYWEDMSAFVDYVRTRPGCSATTPFVLTYINSTSGGLDSQCWVRYVNESIVKSRPNMAALDTRDLVPMEPGDPYHYTLANYKVIDTRWSPAVAAAKAAAVAPGAGATLKGEWFLGADNPLFQAGQPGSRNPAVVLAEGTPGVNNAGYYTQATGIASGFTSPVIDDTVKATYVLVFRPKTATPAGLLSCSTATAANRLRYSISSSGGVTFDAGPNPFAAAGVSTSLTNRASDDFIIFAVCVDNEERSIVVRVPATGAIPAVTSRGVVGGTRVPSGGPVQLGNLARNNGSYPGAMDLAYFGAWSGKLLMGDLLALRDSLVPTLAGRGVTVV